MNDVFQVLNAIGIVVGIATQIVLLWKFIEEIQQMRRDFKLSNKNAFKGTFIL